MGLAGDVGGDVGTSTSFLGAGTGFLGDDGRAPSSGKSGSSLNSSSLPDQESELFFEMKDGSSSNSSSFSASAWLVSSSSISVMFSGVSCRIGRQYNPLWKSDTYSFITLGCVTY